MMRIIIFIALIIFYNPKLYSQVGIGTTEPTKDLDINGELRIRNIPFTTTSTDILTSDIDGNVTKFSTFLISDVNTVIAQSKVDVTIIDATTKNDIDLGLSTTVLIPANTNAVVLISYSVPIGMPSFLNSSNGYYGIRFLKDGLEAPQGSRKFSINRSENTVNMVSVSNTYTEIFTPEATDRTITYTLNGYIEQVVLGSHDYRFNMWSATGANFNWGRASLNKIVYLK